LSDFLGQVRVAGVSRGHGVNHGEIFPRERLEGMFVSLHVRGQKLAVICGGLRNLSRWALLIFDRFHRRPAAAPALLSTSAHFLQMRDWRRWRNFIWNHRDGQFLAVDFRLRAEFFLF
jgi:hypothetical protein